jgi:hypothetical protein
MAAPLLIGTAMAADAPEPLGAMEFSFDRITVYGDDGGEPGDKRTKLDVDSINRGNAMLQKWDNETQMMLIDFGQGTVGWVKKSDLVPPANVCKGKPQVKTASAAVGGNTTTRTLASRGLLSDKACN